MQALAGSAHHQTESASCLAFAVAGVNDKQAARLLLIILTAPFVFLFFGHKVRNRLR